uniref:Uncharacterized protein n=1 Tax=Amphimedon queenslandica TaxID=400682 RepID=A0A1X7UHV1_AMPQE
MAANYDVWADSKLSELAQHVDFREERADDDNDREEGKKKQEEEEEGVSGPKTKKPTLTEVSVLSDVLQIVHNHHQYLSLDPVYVNKKYTLPPSYRYQIKKKVLDVGSKILRKGAEPLKRLSSQTDHKFYRALYDLRRRWILRRTANGVSGDLSYRSVVPQELRGRSEVVIFLADRPIKEVVSLDSLLPSCFIELHKQQLVLTPWEQILKSVQNVFFNEELFAQVMISGWVIEPYRYKEKLLTQVKYLVQVGVVVGGVKHDVH